MVDAHEVEERGVEVMDADFVHDGLEADIVRRAVVYAGFHSRACKPGGERMGVVVAAGLRPLLRNGQPPELARADDERVF